MNTIKPLETVYNGYRFRSRLEARWAVFFDAAGIKYEYEQEGYETETDGGKYLPDFFLPEMDVHIEVKGNRKGAWDEIKRAQKMIAWGSPIKRILILSDIPNNYDGGMWHFPCIYWDGANDKQVVGWWFFYDDYAENEKARSSGHISSADYHPPWHILEDGSYKYFAFDVVSFQAVSDIELGNKKKERFRNAYYGTYGEDAKAFEEEFRRLNYEWNRNTFEAYSAARQARFEHGEKPIVRRK